MNKDLLHAKKEEKEGEGGKEVQSIYHQAQALLFAIIEMIDTS